jgi:REP element-mobilizing transposase RayT
MSTFTQIYYHIVFSTREREQSLVDSGREDLYRYVWGIIKNRHGHLYRINAVDDHIHFLCDLHPTIPLADLVKEIKGGSSYFIKEKGLFPKFTSWQDGYGAFTHSAREKDQSIEYIKCQEEHHKRITFADELRNLLEEVGVAFDAKFLV